MGMPSNPFRGEAMNRRLFIGGSDIAGVMGLSRWNTPLQLWSEKTGKIERDEEETEFQEMGKELEETVARLFTKRTGKKVRRAPKTYQHKDHEFMRCQVDRLVAGTNELLECKTASAWKEKEWEDQEIPQEYILQVMWCLGISGRSIGHIAVLIGGNKFLYKQIDFDTDLFQSLVNQAKIFWNLVKKDIAPMAMGNDSQFMVELHPESAEDLLDRVNLNTSILLRQETIAKIKELEGQKNTIEAQVKQVIGD